jgi:Mu transposase, C-terminal domain
MAYRATSIMDVWDIIRRWHDGQAIKDIVRSTGYDRNTVRSYRKLALRAGLSLEKPLPEQQEVLRLLQSQGYAVLGRQAEAQARLLPLLDEIRSLINPPNQDSALKAKSAFIVISGRHPELAGNVSYSSFKRFVRTNKLTLYPQRASCRVEVPPGNEIQIDYARVGKLFDPAKNAGRILYCFIATLAHSRLKYVELTYRQDQVSFAASHVHMFEFFGGVTARLCIDNLRSGVIKPDLYDPSLNRTYADLIAHYGTFVDTARVRHPKDKGKVERDVQTVREAVRIRLIQNPTITLHDLNRLMKQWSLTEYGLTEHGTTHEKPFVVFTQRERPVLKPLPERSFELAQWKQATVHPDHYIQYHGKAFSVPHAYLGKKVWIRASERILKVFFDEQLIKQHVITSAFRHTDFNDFPENVRAALDTSYIHKNLLGRASKIGPLFHRLIEDLLKAHAYINLRRAQGLLAIAEGACPSLVEHACRLIHDHGLIPTPHNFRHLLAKCGAEASTPNVIPLSEATAEFVRDITYFVNNERTS